MSKTSLFYATIAAFSLVSALYADEAAIKNSTEKGMPEKPVKREFQRNARYENQSERIFFKMISRPDFMTRLGLPDDKVKTINEGIKLIKDKENALYAQRLSVIKTQADIMTQLLEDRTKPVDEVKATFAEIEKIQVKLGELMIDRMLIIRDNLTDEQIKKAVELVKGDFEKRRDELSNTRGVRDRSEQRSRRGEKKQGDMKAPAEPKNVE